jgi:hypothetical protein
MDQEDKMVGNGDKSERRERKRKRITTWNGSVTN